MFRKFIATLPYIFGLLALLLGGSSFIEYPFVIGHLQRVAPDSDVLSYTANVHEHIQKNLRTAASTYGTVALLLFFMREWLTSILIGTGGIRAFFLAFKKFRQDYWTRTSSGHKNMVLLLIGIGVVMRAIMMFQPITYDEAFTYTYFASRPIHIILTDYAYPNNHVLHTLLVKLFTGLFGIGKVQLRIPAFIAGTLCLPLFYLFVRHMFNRYIALIALAFVAVSPRLVEYSALGRGYAITWLCFVVVLLLGRRFAKENDMVSGVLIGLVCALGFFTVPTMIYSVLLVYIWLFLYINDRYEDSRTERWINVLASFLVYVLVAAVVYTPLWIVNGTEWGRLSAKVTRTLEVFTKDYGDNAFDLWVWFSEPGGFWLSVVGFMGLVYAGYISNKYRFLLIAMFLGAVPLVTYQMEVPPPRVWAFTLFIFHLGSAISAFYLLKYIHGKGALFLTERRRAIFTSMAILIGYGYPGMELLLTDESRSGEAEASAKAISARIGPNDRVLVQYPWEAPVEFEAAANGVDREAFYRPYTNGMTVFTVVGTEQDQTLNKVLTHNGLYQKDLPLFEIVDDTDGLKTFVARK